ncbi:MAG: ANTAR domain-containing response regulator, partial [Acidimicrobiia bacterium]
SSPSAFSAKDISLGQTFASHVAVAVTNAHLYNNVATTARQMQDAMESRAIIEQAKGILMAQSSVSAEEAFDLLVRASQRENRKLREIAQAIVTRATSGS